MLASEEQILNLQLKRNLIVFKGKELLLLFFLYDFGFWFEFSSNNPINNERFYAEDSFSDVDDRFKGYSFNLI